MYSEVFFKALVKNIGVMSGVLLTSYCGWSLFKYTSDYKFMKRSVSNKETNTTYEDEDNKDYKNLLDKMLVKDSVTK